MSTARRTVEVKRITLRAGNISTNGEERRGRRSRRSKRRRIRSGNVTQVNEGKENTLKLEASAR